MIEEGKKKSLNEKKKKSSTFQLQKRLQVKRVT